MSIDRRNVLFAVTAVATAATQSVRSGANNTRVSQEELDAAILLHSIWLSDITSGRRCMFGARDLSGLRFAGGRSPIDLSGADFSQADLSATEADNILLQYSNLNGAKLDNCRWRRPVFAHADMSRISARVAQWGIPGDRDSKDRVAADFRHTRLANADLTKARICGFFYESDLRYTSLKETDLSFSDFLGPNLSFDMNFSGARMRDAKLRHCRISNASFYNSDCRATDFFGTQFCDVNMNGCDLNFANFENAEVELTMFSLDQIRQVELSAAYDVDRLGLVQIGNRFTQ